MVRMILCTLVAFGLVSAQTESTKEAGAYERKSVTYINALWLADATVKTLSADQVSYMLGKVKKGLTMPRFDYNAIPESFLKDFVIQANQIRITENSSSNNFFSSGSDPMLDSLAAVMERTIVPKILEAVDIAKEERAANLTSEQQRNSFVADKAKTMGITMEDVEKVMNSAYIYIPVIKGYSATTSNNIHHVNLSAGIIWFHISTKDGKAKATPVVKKFTFSMAAANASGTYVTESGVVDAKDFVYRSAVKNATRNLLTATQEIPDFKLSGQVLETSGMGVGFNLGKKEGIKVDDKYRIVETVEEADGKLSQKANGWVLVTSVADSNSKEGYKSKAQTIAGSPFTGAVVSEYPRLPLEIVAKGKMFAFKSNKDSTGLDSLDISNTFGFQVEAQYNIGHYFGVNQFFFDLGYGMGWGSGSGSIAGNKLDRVESGVFELSLVKKFYIGRVALVLQPEFGFQTVDIYTKDSFGSSITNEISSSGFAFNGALEIALSPCCNLGLGAGYQMYSNNDSYNDTYYDNKGITAQVYLTWSPPALPFDPIDMIRGMSGL